MYNAKLAPLLAAQAEMLLDDGEAGEEQLDSEAPGGRGKVRYRVISVGLVTEAEGHSC